MVVGSVKFLKEKSLENYQYLVDLLKNDSEFVIRCGIVGLLKYFIGEDYLWAAINAVDSIKCNKYYVNMAISWLISEVLIKNPQKAYKIMQKIIKNNHFNSFIINKSIQKACESFRINNELKNKLRELKVR